MATTTTTKRPSAPDVEPVLTMREVERTYGVPVGTLKYWRHHDRGPQSFLRGGKVVYKVSVLAAYFEREQAATTRGGVR